MNTDVFENKFPGGIGFINGHIEVFVVKENLYNQLFVPHFHLYDHVTGNIQTLRFDKLDRCSQNVLYFLGTIRKYSMNPESCTLPRSYYDDLMEIVNKRPMRRKFIWI